MPNFCAAPNCTRKSTQSDLAFFRFPRDPERYDFLKKLHNIITDVLCLHAVRSFILTDMKLIPPGKGKPKLHLQVTDDFSVEILSAC